MFHAAALIAASGLLSSSAFAQNAPEILTASMLAELCETQDESLSLACVSFFRGFRAFALGQQFYRPASMVICIPDAVQGEEMAAVFIAYVRRNPSDGRQIADAVAFIALRDRYPCGAAR